MLELYDSQMALKIAIIKKSIASLDLDFARHIVLSGLSLDINKVYKTSQLMAHLQTMRIFKEKENEITQEQLDSLNELSLKVIPETYFENTIQ